MEAPSLSAPSATDPAFHDPTPSNVPTPTDGSKAQQLPLLPSASTTQQERNPQPRVRQSRSSIFKRRSYLSDDSRRDSGMAPSMSTTDERPGTGDSKPSFLPMRPRTAPHKSSTVPSIVVNDSAEGKLPGLLRRPKSRGNMSSRQSVDQAPPVPVVAGPFRGLVTSIPSGEFEDPFSSNDLGFSKRGSVLLSGVKPVPELGSAPHSRGNSKEIVGAVPSSTTVPRTVEDKDTAQQQPDSTQITANQDKIGPLRRSASADDQRLSQRIRSWYEPPPETSHGAGHFNASSFGPVSPGSEEADTVPDLPDMLSPRIGGLDDRLRESRSASVLSGRSSTQRERYEAAGGIEDWTDLDGRDVDRYGFYNARALNSKRSSIVSSVPPGVLDPSQPRPASALSGNADGRPQSRRLSQTPRVVGSSRPSISADGKLQRTTPSMITSRSTRSRASMLRPMSRQRRLVEEAGSMLTPMYTFSDSEDHIQSTLSHTTPSDRNLERSRALKWARMGASIATSPSRKGGGTDFRFRMSHPKLISRTWKGIPDCWRGAAWYSFLSTSAKRRSTADAPQPSDNDLETFFTGCQDQDCDDDMQIDMDVPRTVGGHVVFRQRYKGGQRFLFRVLRALSLYFPATGYVQGMAAVVATLLNYYTEERAFVMAVRLWTLRGIGYLYSEGFEGLMMGLSELQDVWMKDTDIIKQLKELGIEVSAWGPKWYLTLFNYVLPFPAMLRVWDVFILLGDPALQSERPKNMGPQAGPRPIAGTDEKTTASLGPKPNLDVLHAVGTAMLTALHDTIIGADFENAMGVLTAPVPVAAGREDILMDVARKEYNARIGKRR